MQPPRFFGSLWMSALLGFATAALFLATLQAGLFNDGVYFEEKLRTGKLGHVHLLNLPMMAVLQRIYGWFITIDPETTIKVTAALFGGLATALTHRLGLRLLPPGQAVAAAALLAVVPGFWFHATASEIHTVHTACALLLLLGLIRALDPESGSLSTSILVFFGALLGPASHASGAAAGLAGAFVVWRAPRRLPVAAAGLLGFAGYLGLQKLVAAAYPGVEFGNAVESMLFPVRHPERIPQLLSSAASELVLFAVPASTLTLAGLLRFGRARRAECWTMVLWMLGYLIVTLPVYDRAFSSYFIPVFPIHAVAAVAAAAQLGRRRGRWVVALILAAAPLAGVRYGDPVTLPLFAVCSLILARLCRTEKTDDAAPVWLLPAAAAALTALVYLPSFSADPVRQRIRTVAAYAGENPLIIAFIPDSVVSYHWGWHYPGSNHAAWFVVNPFMLDLLQAAEQGKDRPQAEVDAAVRGLRASIEQRIRDALAEGRPVLLVEAPEFTSPPGPGARFRSELATKFRVRTPADAPQHVHRIELR